MFILLLEVLFIRFKTVISNIKETNISFLYQKSTKTVISKIPVTLTFWPNDETKISLFGSKKKKNNFMVPRV